MNIKVENKGAHVQQKKSIKTNLEDIKMKLILTTPRHISPYLQQKKNFHNIIQLPCELSFHYLSINIPYHRLLVPFCCLRYMKSTKQKKSGNKSRIELVLKNRQTNTKHFFPSHVKSEREALEMGKFNNFWQPFVASTSSRKKSN